MDVMPVVDLGRQAAKATVGEPFPVRATVFREGHDRLAAEVVLTAPDGSRRPPVRMTKHESIPDRYDAWVTPDVGGAVDLRGPRVVRPDRDVGAQRRAQDPGRRRRGADVRGGPGPVREGARRGRPGQRRGQAAPGRDRRGRRPRPAAGRPAGGAAGPRPRGGDGGAPDPRAGDDRGSLPGVRRPRAGAVRQLVRVLPPLGGRRPRRRRHGRRAAPSRPPPSGSTRWPPWASTSSTCRRSTRSGRSTARAPTTR